jgi:hypothetical protein
MIAETAVEEPSAERGGPKSQPRSSSVEFAIRQSSSGDVTAAKIAADILISHPHYGSNRGSQFGATLTSSEDRSEIGQRKPAALWVEEVSALFDEQTRINGRCVVVGLALLDEVVRVRLLPGGFLAELSREKGEGPSVAEGLDAKPREALESMLAARTGPLASGSVETFSDSPAAADQLGRRAFADVLAARIRRLRANEPSAPIVIHLDGPWGSGKSTVLNFLEDSLRETTSFQAQRWIVVRYNAWQYQRVETPWWTLSARLIAATANDLLRSGKPLAAFMLCIRNYCFKAFSGRTWVLIAGLFALVVGVGLFRFSIPPITASDGALKSLASAAKDLLSVVVAIFGIVLATSRFLTASDTTSQDFIKSRPDPIGSLTNHLERIFKPLDRNIAVLIDDIDRCDASTVVKTLEGVHTVFATLPIVFIVAGDGRWIEQAFEKAYGDSAPRRSDGGQTLGGLFLEKLFQISASIPHMPSPIKDAFWKQLLHLAKESKSEAGLSQAAEMAKLKDEDDILAEVRAVDARQHPEKALALREAAMRRLAEPDLIDKPAGHVLEVFRDSVESNPRAMKRQVMAYGMARATDLASFQNTPQSVLATLSVLSLRWPVLTRWLSEKPQFLRLAYPASTDDSAVGEQDEAMVALLRSPPVTRLLKHVDDMKALETILGAKNDVS